MRHPHIPRTWTAAEALATAERLHALVDAIFDIYRAEIRAELLAREIERDGVGPSPAPPSTPAVDLAPF